MTKTTKRPVKGDEIPFKLPQVAASEKQRAKRLMAALDEHYPDAHCALNFTAPHELLIATILSAQCTDVAVNKATPALFEAFPEPTDYAASTAEEIEPYVKTLGFFRNKAKAVHLSMKEVVDNYGGEVPQTMEDLLTLRGVARKTANVVLSNAFGIHNGVVVDTHVQRLSRRLGLVDEGASVAAIEKKLMALFPRERWGDLSHVLIWHGRGACSARKKECADHPICKGYGKSCECRGS